MVNSGALPWLRNLSAVAFRILKGVTGKQSLFFHQKQTMENAISSVSMKESISFFAGSALQLLLENVSAHYHCGTAVAAHDVQPIEQTGPRRDAQCRPVFVVKAHSVFSKHM